MGGATGTRWMDRSGFLWISFHSLSCVVVVVQHPVLNQIAFVVNIVGWCCFVFFFFGRQFFLFCLVMINLCGATIRW